MEAREPVYKNFKTAWRSFYKSFLLMLLIIVLAVCAVKFIPYVKENQFISKLILLVAAVIDVIIFLTVIVKRSTMALILRDNPSKPEDQEIAYIVSHPLKPFSSDFHESIEISLANIIHIKVRQTMMQTLLKVGDIVITSAGTGNEEIQAENIPNPQAVRDEIQVHVKYYALSK